MKCTTQGYDCNSNVIFKIGNSSFKSVICGKGRVVPVLKYYATKSRGSGHISHCILFTMALNRSEWSALCFSHFTPCRTMGETQRQSKGSG